MLARAHVFLDSHSALYFASMQVQLCSHMTFCYVMPTGVKCLIVVAVAHVDYTKNATIDSLGIANPSNLGTTCFRLGWIYN